MAAPYAPWRFASPGLDPGEAPPDRDWIWKRVTEAPAEVARHVSQGGLELGERPLRAFRIFEGAAFALDAAPDLALLVADRVRLIHVLRAADGYDISHSEPVWEDRIFVSIPERDDRVGALRLAEGVVHEAMHLHLTLWERDCPLVADEAGEIFSPWRQTNRPLGGVLHGLFVFACLSAFFARFREAEAAAARHVRLRLAEIASELATVDLDTLGAGLTDAGRQMVKRFMLAPTPGSRSD